MSSTAALRRRHHAAQHLQGAVQQPPRPHADQRRQGEREPDPAVAVRQRRPQLEFARRRRRHAHRRAEARRTVFERAQV